MRKADAGSKCGFRVPRFHLIAYRQQWMLFNDANLHAPRHGLAFECLCTSYGVYLITLPSSILLRKGFEDVLENGSKLQGHTSGEGILACYVVLGNRSESTITISSTRRQIVPYSSKGNTPSFHSRHKAYRHHNHLYPQSRKMWHSPS